MSADTDVIVFYPSLGHAGDGDLNLRFPIEYGDEIRALLDEQGIDHGGILEHSAGHELAIEAVHVLTNAGSLASLALVFKAFFHRHDGKKVVTKDGEEISGYSRKQVEEMLETLRKDQELRDAETRRVLGRPPVDDVAEDRTSSGS
ncbi:hypothetical protein BJK06_11200 [Curtobacterium sp. BH-2-1-1]|uniref:hypothetical protein n=1 Tax=Curtobacterium sp. BH-2-1-1 TaxID=1905847 RepID=UPI00089DDBCB|nr:hypothetical protein [Curtobacterium sp. BH-2-1-1]AOX66246.1 hypothetical protein BJK06_11200 [Curtobacterium sp. BH-2-1-1]